ncbi:MAG: cupin domain-containing protein [Pirellulaceae bacterium]
MAIPHAKSGEVIGVEPLGANLAGVKTRTLFKAEDLEVIRLVVLAGKEIPPHRVSVEVTVQCLEGRVDFRLGDLKRELSAGTLLYMEGGTEHSLVAQEDSSLLVTIALQHKAAT